MTNYDRMSETLQGPWTTEPKTGTEYRIESREGICLITFPPTTDKSVLDWIQNLSFWKVPYSRMKSRFLVHAGFLAKYKAIRTDLLGTVMALKPMEILVQGYSQGGALAQLAHEDLRFHYEETSINYLGPLSTYTFGSPRVFASFGGQATLRRRMAGLYRYVNRDDLLTHLPPRAFLFGDFGEERHIGPARKWWRLSVEDHYPINYLMKVQ